MIFVSCARRFLLIFLYSTRHSFYFLYLCLQPSIHTRKNTPTEAFLKRERPCTHKGTEALSFITYRAGTIQLQEEIFPGQQN